MQYMGPPQQQFMGPPPAYNQPVPQQPYGYYKGQPFQQGFNAVEADRQRQQQVINQQRQQQANQDAALEGAVTGAAVAAGICCCLAWLC